MNYMTLLSSQFEQGSQLPVFIILGGLLLIVIVAVIVAVISSVVSAVAAESDTDNE